VGIRYWGVRMFIIMSFVAFLVPWYTMGKPLSVGRAIGSIVASFFVMFPMGALFGWSMWPTYVRNLRKLDP
jgi:hypothetical protein